MDNGDVREDLRIPEGDLGKEIEGKYEAGEEILVSWFGHASPCIKTQHLCVAQAVGAAEPRTRLNWFVMTVSTKVYLDGKYCDLILYGGTPVTCL